ncbi:Ulp1 family isopeptidase [Mesorhizobium carmichaelinearum]|uniref:Ulp1 family isopeptidase n=1 Tax=Mesorhizobium carmichaelinearum TaxID=1208188 RepID=UPI000BA4CA4F|nr:Ulp1 family isopeptidase [Mesorhizobium carmichaelinearum]
MDRIQNGNPSGRYSATYNATVQQRPKQEQAAFEQHLRDVPNVDAAVAHPSQILDVSQDQRIGVRTWRPRKGNSRSPLEPTAQLPLQSFAEEQPLGSAADRGDEYGAPAKRQRTLNNPQAATSLLPAINEVQIRRERIKNSDAPNKDLDGFKRPTNATQNSTLVTVGGNKRALYSEDASLIGVLESALRKGKVGEGTVKLNVNPLLRFARWLAVNGKQGLSTRLGETSLKQDLNQYEGSCGPSLEAPLRHLKTAEAGGVPIVGRSFRNPHSCDEPLIKLNNATQSAALVTVGGNKRALYAEDASLIGVLESALRKGKVAETTFKVNVNPLLNFARWLVANGKHGFATRLDERSLNQDLKQYEGSGGPSLKVPMHHLKIAAAGGSLPVVGRLLRNSNSQDEAVIKQYNATPSAKNVDQAKSMRYTSALKPFNDYLDKNGKIGISDRLNHKALDLGKSGVGKLGSGRHIAPVLRDDAHFVAAPPIRARSNTFGGLQSFVDLNAPTPSDLRDDAHFAPAPPVRARSNTFGGLQSFVDLNAPTPSDLRDDAHFAPAPPVRARSNTFGGLQSFVDLNAPTPSDLRDDAHSAPVRPRGQMLRESEWQPMMQATGSAVAGTGGPDDFRPVHRGRLSPMSEAAPSRPARAPQPASPVIPRLPDSYRGLPLVDVTTLTTSSSNTHIGALDTTASSNVPNGSVLDATEWLSDAHIQRDYQLLEEELQTTDPTLAARTRLVDPSVSHLLRHMAPQDARDTLQSIYNQNDAPADFLFLPVNNGTPTTPGTHWSLLLVDRRKPETRLAYHYDSLQREGYNDVPAKQLAGLLNATLAPARMPRQSNDYDCGVFVLDSTWALVGRLLDGERPDREPLHLDNLVADRQALQDRLTRPLPHEERPRQLLDHEPASPPMVAFEPGELRRLLDD